MLEMQQAPLTSAGLATLLDHVPTSVIVFDSDDGHVRYANKHALLAHELTDQEQILAHLCGEAPYSRADWLRAIHQARDQGRHEFAWRTGTGHSPQAQWAISMTSMVIESSSCVVSYGHEVAPVPHTAAFLAQQHRLEAVIEALPVSLSIKDKQGRYLLSNKLFEEAVGLSKERLQGYSAEELFPPAMAEQMCEHDHAAFNTAEMVRYESAHMRRDGTRRDQLVTKVPLLDAHGAPEALVTLSVDISDQKLMQRELASAKNEAERLARVKSEFLANMSHEIRTPLHAVQGLAQVGQHLPPDDPKVTQILGQISRSGRHLLGVINDILDFSKIDAGKLTIDPCAMNPRQLAEDAINMVRERGSAKGLTLTLQCDTAPMAIMGDPLRIRQILINLLSNGIKFTERGGVTLTLTTGHGQLYFSVKDTGIGLDDAAKQRVFSPFEQADSSTTRRFGGTGLGLSISRKLARLMGGDITLDSTPGLGANFSLILPLQEADEHAVHGDGLPPATAGAARPLGAAPAPPQLKGLRVLAADDVDINRDILIGLLTQQEAQVVCAEDGVQLMAVHAAHPPGHFDIVLMDVQMPGLDGLQAARLLRQREADLPVVALTAHALPEERQRCTDAGMQGHLAKPFEAEEMVRLILRHSRRNPDRAGTGSLVDADSSGVAHQASPTPAAIADSLTPVPSDATGWLDLDGALRRCGGKTALLRKLVARFCEDQAAFSARCAQWLQEDPEQARKAAHMLRGTSGNLGLATLSRLAGELESALIAQDAALADHHLQALNLALRQHIALLNDWLDQQVTV